MNNILILAFVACVSLVLVPPASAEEYVVRKKEHEQNTCVDEQGHNVGCPKDMMNDDEEHDNAYRTNEKDGEKNNSESNDHH